METKARSSRHNLELCFCGYLRWKSIPEVFLVIFSRFLKGVHQWGRKYNKNASEFRQPVDVLNFPLPSLLDLPFRGFIDYLP